MTIGCDIWMICLTLNWYFYDPSWMLQLSKFAWTLQSSVWVVFNNFLLIDATDRSKISSDQKRLFFVVSLYHLSFFANTPFKETVDAISSDPPLIEWHVWFTCRYALKLCLIKYYLDINEYVYDYLFVD